MSLDALRRPTALDHGIGFGLMALYVMFLVATSLDVGVPRDESFYFHAGDRAGDWVLGLFDGEVESFSRAAVDRGFEYNNEHPVLMKTLFGLSHRLLHDRWGWVETHITAWRLPTMVMAGLSLWLTWLLGVMVRGRVVGLFAALALAFMPSVFFHSHLACFDAPVMFTTLLIAYCYLRAARSRRWAVASGVALGLGFATKLNTFFVPFTLLLVAAVDVWMFRRRTGAWRAEGTARGPLTYYAWVAGCMVVLGGLVFFAHWPWLWFDTVERVRAYISFHARHVHYPVDYLGHLYFRPPFPVHFPFVFSALTIPVGVLLCGLIGFGVVAREARVAWRAGSDAADRRAVEVFLLANLLVPMLVIAMPYTPIFGGTKHWMPAMPFFAVMAGMGLERLGRGLWPVLIAGRGAGALRLRTVVLGGLMWAPAGWATVTYGAHGPAYYNELAGGPPGGAALGMPRNFWGYSTVEVLPLINERVEPKGLVFWHKATQWAIDAYRRDGMLRSDVRYTGDWTAAYSNWAVYHDQREKLPEELDVWRAYGTDWPVGGFFIDGVALMAVYQRPAPPVAPPVPAGAR